jgi:hypothetical protein
MIMGGGGFELGCECCHHLSPHFDFNCRMSCLRMCYILFFEVLIFFNKECIIKIIFKIKMILKYKRARIVMELFLPFTFVIVGLKVDVFSMANYGWSNLEPLNAMVITGYFSKLVATLVVALLFGVTLIKESLTLGDLTMNLRGLFEAMILLRWLEESASSLCSHTLRWLDFGDPYLHVGCAINNIDDRQVFSFDMLDHLRSNKTIHDKQQKNHPTYPSRYRDWYSSGHS